MAESATARCVVNIVQRRPQTLGIPPGAATASLKVDEVVSLSKRSFCFLLEHPTSRSQTKVYFVKLDASNGIKSYYGCDIAGYLNLKTAFPVIVNRLTEKGLNPAEELTQNTWLLSRATAGCVYAFKRTRTSYGDAGGSLHGFGGAGFDSGGGVGMDQDEGYVVLFKLASYRFNTSAGPDCVNRPISWVSYPAVSLTSTETRNFLNDGIPRIDQALQNIKIRHAHESQKALLLCEICNGGNYAYEGGSKHGFFSPETRYEPPVAKLPDVVLPVTLSPSSWLSETRTKTFDNNGRLVSGPRPSSQNASSASASTEATKAKKNRVPTKSGGATKSLTAAPPSGDGEEDEIVIDDEDTNDSGVVVGADTGIAPPNRKKAKKMSAEKGVAAGTIAASASSAGGKAGGSISKAAETKTKPSSYMDTLVNGVVDEEYDEEDDEGGSQSGNLASGETSFDSSMEGGNMQQSLPLPQITPTAGRKRAALPLKKRGGKAGPPGVPKLPDFDDDADDFEDMGEAQPSQSQQRFSLD